MVGNCANANSRDQTCSREYFKLEGFLNLSVTTSVSPDESHARPAPVTIFQGVNGGRLTLLLERETKFAFI